MKLKLIFTRVNNLGLSGQYYYKQLHEKILGSERKLCFFINNHLKSPKFPTKAIGVERKAANI